MAATPVALASSISRKAAEVQAVSAKLTRLAARLTSDDVLTPAYAFDHAEEELGWAAEALEEAAAAVRSISEYTVTGEQRREGLQRLAAAARL